MNLRSLPLMLAAVLAVAVAVAADVSVVPVTQDTLLERQQADDEALFVLDVRSPEEFASGHVPDAVNIPYDQVATRLHEVPRDKDVVLYCRSGRRALIAADTLATNGYTRLQYLEGDIVAWIDKGRPTETPGDAAACVAALKGGGPAEQACAPP
jgi:phage shock protein E